MSDSSPREGLKSLCALPGSGLQDTSEITAQPLVAAQLLWLAAPSRTINTLQKGDGSYTCSYTSKLAWEVFRSLKVSRLKRPCSRGQAW